MKQFTKGLLVVCACSLPLISIAQTTTSSTVKDFSGSYTCQRTDNQNNTSSNPLSITKTGDTYTLQWLDGNGYPMMYGTGATSTGTLSNLLSVVFWDAKNAEVFGDELFFMNSEGTLQGELTLQSTKNIGTEICTKSKT